jgi:hypothetical protein
MRTDERSAVFGFSRFKGLPELPWSMRQHGHPFREQAMAVRLGSRDEHRVMEAMADMSLVTKGQQPARANGDCGVGGMNSIAEGGEEAIEPSLQSADARLLASGNSPDGRLAGSMNGEALPGQEPLILILVVQTVRGAGFSFQRYQLLETPVGGGEGLFPLRHPMPSIA